MTDPHEHNEPAEHWRDCHACAKELLTRLATGVLLLGNRTPGFWRVRRSMNKRTMKIARAVVNDDLVD